MTPVKNTYILSPMHQGPLFTQQGSGPKHVTVSVFSPKAEERIVSAVERLVDYLTNTAKDHHTSPNASEKSPIRTAHTRIEALKKELAEANAKLSQRF